jgi:hypothetical protein
MTKVSKIARGQKITPVGSKPTHENQDDEDDQDDADKADAAMTVAVTVAAEAATEAAKQEDDEDDDKDQSHDIVPSDMTGRASRGNPELLLRLDTGYYAANSEFACRRHSAARALRSAS